MAEERQLRNGRFFAGPLLNADTVNQDFGNKYLNLTNIPNWFPFARSIPPGGHSYLRRNFCVDPHFVTPLHAELQLVVDSGVERVTVDLRHRNTR